MEGPVDNSSVKMHEAIIWLRHDVLNLLDHLNTPHVEVEAWWEDLERRLVTVELWRRMLLSEEGEYVAGADDGTNTNNDWGV